MTTVQILTFGCQMNKLDSELMREAILAAGFLPTENESVASVVIFNTCAVREHAEERVTQRIRQVKNRAAKIIVAGCAAEHLGADLLRKFPQVFAVCGTRYFTEIAEIIHRVLQDEKIVAVGGKELVAPGALAAHPRSYHTGFQGFVSAMRGCNNFCAYCIVPLVRGREESRPANEIIKEAQGLAERGAREITLLGQNVDAYGKNQNSSLADLLSALDDQLPPAIKRIRFVTSHPRDITEKLLRTLAARQRIAKHLHMPAQSGADKILTAMKRGYTRKIYDERLRMIMEFVPAALVTSDFIVGFCGESDADFAATVDLIERARFQNIFVFKYSPRPRTWAAENLRDDIPLTVKKERNQTLLKIQEKISAARHESLIGENLEILVEGFSERDAAKMHGRTSNNLNVVFTPPEQTGAMLIGELTKVRIARTSPLSLFGEIENLHS